MFSLGFQVLSIQVKCFHEIITIGYRVYHSYDYLGLEHWVGKWLKTVSDMKIWFFSTVGKEASWPVSIHPVDLIDWVWRNINKKNAIECWKNKSPLTFHFNITIYRFHLSLFVQSDDLYLHIHTIFVLFLKLPALYWAHVYTLCNYSVNRKFHFVMLKIC